MEEALSSSELLLLLVLFIFSAFFSSSETAFLSVNKYRLEKLAREGNKSAKLALKLLSNPQLLITTILIGNNLVNIAAASLSAAIAIKLFGDLGVGIATAIVTVLTIIFGEVLPKNFALKYSEKLVLLFSRPLYVIKIIFYPLSWLLMKITERLFPENEEKSLSQEEIKIILEHSKNEGVLDDEEKEIIENVLELKDTLVKEIMTPRTEIVAIEVNYDVNEILEKIKESSYSKLPVYENDLDNIVGVVYLKDVLRNLNTNKKAKDLAKKVLFVPENKKVDDLFEEMRKNKSKIAIVIDEYGSVSGLITLEDILEYLIGEINDKKNKIKKITKNIYIMDGNTPIYEIERVLNREIETNSSTVAGLIIEKLQRIPNIGEKIKINNITFEVVEKDKGKIKKLKMIVGDY